MTTDLWHRRLGHPTPRILNLLVSGNKIIFTFRRSLAQCQTCSLGKLSHLSLRSSGHKTSTPLDLIFNDVWGPTPMFFFVGFHYFLIFVDARTRHKWYYLLVAKSDVFSIFQHFQTLVERQFSFKIKFVQTD